MIKVGSDFSGVGCFDEALKMLGIEHETVFACDMDKYARKTYIANHGEPKYYPDNIYNREIPEEPLDVYMTSPPCQVFSLAGKRKGKEDLRGILFFNSLEFIQKNNPRYFIFENVKGLLSDNKKNSKDELGQTFTEWITLLGGKSVNGNPVMFPHEESVPYHIYWKVLNATDYGVPQNRERVFIIGIRDDSENTFTWPKEIPLEKRLRDCLDDEVDEKYYLSQEMVDKFVLNSKGSSIGYINPDTQASQVFSEDGLIPTICAGTHGYALGYVSVVGRVNSSQDGQVFDIKGISQCLSAGHGNSPKITVKSATKKGFETATPEDSINLSHPNSETRRGRVGVGVAQTLDTQCNQGILKITINEKKDTYKILQELQQEVGEKEVRERGFRILEIIRQKSLLRQKMYEDRLYGKRKEKSARHNDKDEQGEGSIIVARIIMRSLHEEGWKGCTPQGRKSIKQLIRKLNEGLSELSHEDSSSTENMQSKKLQHENKRIGLLRKTLPEIQKIWKSANVKTQDYRIRRLTPRETFRLMGFGDHFKIEVSDTQAYKQAGNGIVTNVICEIISKLNLKK